MTDKIEISGKALRLGWWMLAAIVFGVVIAIRIRLLGIPLERDEGEYAYAGQLILQGIPPYKLAYNMKFPGTYAAYAVIMSIFGQTVTGIHLGLLFVNAATVVLIFFLGRQLISSTVGLAAAMSYAVLSASPSVLGFAGHATHFVLLPVLGGTLLLCSSTDRQALGRLFASGLLFGTGLLMKQPAVFFASFGAIYVVSGILHRGAQAEKNSRARPDFQCRNNSSIRNYLSGSLANRRFREVLVLDNRLRAPIWQPGSFQCSAANLRVQR